MRVGDLIEQQQDLRRAFGRNGGQHVLEIDGIERPVSQAPSPDVRPREAAGLRARDARSARRVLGAPSRGTSANSSAASSIFSRRQRKRCTRRSGLVSAAVTA